MQPGQLPNIIYLGLTLCLFALGSALPVFGQERGDSSRHSMETWEERDPFLLDDQRDEIKMKLLENRLTLENVPADGVLEVYNIMGVKVFTRRVRAGINEVTLNVPRGYYIIKIGKFTRKIAIK